MFSDMLNHKCDIYHIRHDKTSPGYDLPGEVKTSFLGVPDIEDLECHFHSPNAQIIQSKPGAQLTGRIKLSIPKGTEIFVADKVVDKQTQLEYTVEVPTLIRQHHKIVWLRLNETQERVWRTASRCK